MKTTCKVLWIGTGKSGEHHYALVSYILEDFICKAFVEITAEKAATLEVGAEIAVPNSALRQQ